MAITRITARWSGFSGAPGYSSFHFNASDGGAQVDAAAARVRSFFIALQYQLPDDVVVDVQPEAEIIDETTGVLQDYANTTEVPETARGQGDTTFAGPVGGVVNWTTNTVVGGRRLRGRTFVVPMGNDQFDSAGTLSTVALTAMNNAANALIGGGTGPELVVWARPGLDGAGAIGTVTGHRVPDLAAVLRSRRD